MHLLASRERGVTLIELMVTLVLTGILVALAVPSYRLMIEKRQVEAAAEELQNFIKTAQSLAVKRNEDIAMRWWAENEGHGADFCLGISSPPKDVPCDCRKTNPTDDNFCSVGASADNAADGTPYRVTRADLVEENNNFVHFRPRQGSYTFDRVRGTMLAPPPANSVSGVVGQNFRFHSHLLRPDSDNGTLFALDVTVNWIGRVDICNDNREPQRVGPWGLCGY